MSNKSWENSSSIPKLKVPEFKPSIPDHMVEGIQDQTLRFLVEQVSIIKQQNKWQSEHLAQVFDYTRKINGKVIELEKYRQEMEVKHKVTEELQKKTQKAKKFILPLIVATLGVLYPLYVAVFVETGASNVVNSALKTLIP